jgi:addiction module RelE/StbE family toxin
MTHEITLKWTQRALGDLARIAEYIARDSTEHSARFVKLIRAKAENLKTFPNMGRIVLPGVRELVIHCNYLLSYRVKNDCVEILQVWHVAQRRDGR